MDPLQTLSDVVAQLDGVVSLAGASVSAPVPYVRPRLLEEGEGGNVRRMELLQARHPCMETDADTAFIPNDICFVQGEKSFYIITGISSSSSIGIYNRQFSSECNCQDSTLRLVDCELGIFRCETRTVSRV